MVAKNRFDERCLDLARYFYPNQSIAFLEALAQAFQDCVEGREDTDDETLPIPDFLRNQENLRAERASQETRAHPEGSCLIGGDCDHVKETPAIPPGYFWRGEAESNRNQCRNCGEDWDKHLHTDESSTCPTANR